MTIFTSGIPSYAADASSRAFAGFEITIKYLEEHLAPQDIQFMNVRGFNGAPKWSVDLSRGKQTGNSDRLFLESVNALARYLYADPADPSARAAAYYSAQLLEHNKSAIMSLNFMLTHGGLDEASKTNLRQSMANLQNLRANQTQRYQEQMTRLLDDFNGLLEHRGIADEANIIEVIDNINAVKHNIASFTSPDLSEESAQFFDIYTKDIKHQCEFWIAQGRNPFHLDGAFFKNIHAGQPLDQAWRNAMETERPRVRAIADQLKEILRPYARISPISPHETGGEMPDATPPSHLPGRWNWRNESA